VRDGRYGISTVTRAAVASTGRGGTVGRQSSLERQFSAGRADVDGLGVLADVPVIECWTPVADISAGDFGGEGLRGTGCDGEFVELTEDNGRVIGTTERDVELGNFLALDRASVGNSGSDSVEDIVEAGVATGSSRSRKKRLGCARRRASREAVVTTVVGISR
jgi:hypothetical protein